MNTVLFSTILAACVLVVTADKIHFKDCGSRAGVVHFVDISGCSSFPCMLQRGQNYTVQISFTSNAASKTATVKASGTLMGIPMPYPVDESDACKLGVKCPIVMSDTNTYTYQMYVKRIFPSVRVAVSWEIQNDAGKDMVCVAFPAEVV